MEKYMHCATAGGWRRIVIVFVLGGFCFSPIAEAQVFKRIGGLFGRDTDAPLAQQTEDEIGVPVPVTGRVEALKGHEVSFEIQAHSKTPGAMVEFLIRDFPSAGRIVSMVSKPLERNKAIVTYYADPDSGAEADVFSFAVRYRGGRYSSAMRYDIDLAGTSAQIQVTEEVDFGEVMIGGEEVREVYVKNLGDATFERQLVTASPWHILSPADGKLSLGPKATNSVKVAFRPTLTGETSYFLSLSRSKEGTCKLIGRGQEPFAIETESVELKLDPETRERVGAIKVANRGPKPLLVEARASSRIQNSLSEEYVLAPEATTDIKVHLGKTDTAPFDGMVQFFLDNGYTKSAKVFSPVVPGEIKVDVANQVSSEVINFGKVNAGRSTERSLTVTNIGGVAMPLEFHIPEPFRLLTNPGPRLDPLSAVQISIGLYPGPTQKGLVDSTMNVFANEQNVSIRLLGNVVGSAKGAEKKISSPNLPGNRLRMSSGVGRTEETESIPPGALDVPASEAATVAVNRKPEIPSDEFPTPWYHGLTNQQVEKLRSPSGFITRPLVQREINSALRPPEDLNVLEVGSDSLTIGWTAPKNSELNTFEVELRGVQVPEDTKIPESVWAPYGRVKFERVDRLVKAEIKGLAPITTYEFRVVMVDENGRSSEASEAMSGRTDLPMDWTYIYLVLGIGFVILVAVGTWKVIKDRQPEVYQSKYADL